MEKYIKEFDLDIKNVQHLVETQLTHMQNGLFAESASIRMIPTFTDIPHKEVNGSFLAIDFGGTNMRCVLVKIEKNKIVGNWQKSAVIDHTTPSGKKLLGDLGQVIEDFLKENEDKLTPRPEVLLAGYTFSFPVNQTSLKSGFLIRWTKEFVADGCEGEDATRLLQEELNRRGLTWVHINALCNDTVGTLCSAVLGDPDTSMGVILGTGNNGCYREKVTNIKKLTPPADFNSKFMIINCEWGSFNGFPHTSADNEVYEKTKSIGEQKFEKMISGRYCPMIAAEALSLAMRDGALQDLEHRIRAAREKEGKKVGVLVPYDEHSRLSLIEMSDVQFDSTPDLSRSREILVQFADIPDGKDVKVSVEELKQVQRLFTNIVDRSAKLCAIAMASCVAHTTMHVEVKKRFTIAIDGSVYHKYKGYAEKIDRYVHECLESLRGKKFVTYTDKLEEHHILEFPKEFPEVCVIGTVDGSGLGAAIICAANA